MPALNEEKRIATALNSIRKQTINQDEVEILVIDGGSDDKTREIAESYGARIIENPKTVPEEAKCLVLINCTGRYIVFMDADEELAHEDQMKRRLELFSSCDKVKAIICNCLNTPKGYPKLTRYVNSFGDPFSHFIYRYDGENIIASLDKKSLINERYGEFCRVYFVEEGNVAIIGDGGTTMFDFEYMKMQFSNRTNDPVFASTRFDEVVSKTGCFGVIDNDAINHYTTVKFKTYLKKLKFRVMMNLNPEENSFGFTARSQINRKLKTRKFLFLLYCLLPPIVLIDSTIMASRKKCFTFILHFTFVYYVLFQIVIYSFLKVVGFKLKVSSYGK